MIGKKLWRRWKFPSSLRAKVLYVLLLAGGCSLLLFWGGYKLTDYLISTYYLKDSAIAERTLKDSRQFQDFVTKNRISSSNTKEIARWTLKKHDIDLLFYRGNRFIFEIGWGDVYQDNPSPDSSDNPDYTRYSIRFSDGVMTVFMLDYSESYLYDLSNIILLVLCCLIFVLFSLLYTNKLIHTIIILSHKVKEISAGNLQKEICLPGRDELSSLASDIDQMRKSIRQQMQKEQSAWQANNDLITAISHDIRTPLTALIGYLDLAVGKQYDTPQELEQYLAVCQSKAMQLKSMTDELFQYFVVFGRSELTPDIQAYDASVVLQQLVGEHIIQLQMNGFRCTEKPLQSPCEILTDIDCLKRVLDNLFVNIKKYADSCQPVVTESKREGGFVLIHMTNQIPKTSAAVVSTKIGLRTCEKIMSQINGKIVFEQTKSHFSVKISIPCRDSTAKSAELSENLIRP